MIAIIDYDAGNIRSVEKAIHHLGYECVVTRDAKKIKEASNIILPGVGAFGTAMDNLIKYDLVNVIKDVIKKGTPFLGICLGMQLLVNESEESKGVKGLSLIDGKCFLIPKKEDLKIPHMGWNNLQLQKKSRLFTSCDDKDFVYFVHSYYVKSNDRESVSATCTYSVTMDVAFEKDNIFATQFHPEKSSNKGLAILNNFLNVK